MPSLTLDDGKLKIHYRDAGQGSRPIVLLHGFPFTSGLWEPQTRALSRAYRVIAPDLRGFGDTGLQSSYSLDHLADDVAELLSTLGLDRVVLGGLSMGGYVALAFFKRHAQRLNGLILSDTRPDADSKQTRAYRARLAELAKQAGSAAVADELLPALLSPTTRAHRPDVVNALRTMISSSKPEAIAAALAAMADRDDSSSLLPTIDVPVLMTGGTEDTLTPPALIEGWAANIPNAYLAFIAGAGHVANLERPDDFNTLVTEFLDIVYGQDVEWSGRT